MMDSYRHMDASFLVGLLSWELLPVGVLSVGNQGRKLDLLEKFCFWAIISPGPYFE